MLQNQLFIRQFRLTKWRFFIHSTIRNACSCLNTDYIEFAYPLAKGGVAVHFKDSYQAEEAINNWPGKVFGEKESAHCPRGNSGSKVGFAKDVDTRYCKQQILQILKDKGCTVNDVKRMFHRNTSRPMPVVKIFRESHEDLIDTINTELGLKFFGKKNICGVGEKKESSSLF